MTDREQPNRGRVAWVTGGSSGIGAATVELLGRDGATAGVLDLQPPTAQVAFERCDIADPAAVKAAVTALRERTGPPDILVNNAGIPVTGSLTNLSDAQWERALSVNLSGAFYLIRATMGHMIDQGWGRIVSVTSTTATRVTAGRAAYAASKAGLIALTKAAAVEGAPYAVTANTVAPGVVDTPLTRGQYGSREQLEDTVRFSPISNPMRAVIDSHDVAHAIRFLTLPESRHITGDLLYVNAGSYMS